MDTNFTPANYTHQAAQDSPPGSFVSAVDPKPPKKTLKELALEHTESIVEMLIRIVNDPMSADAAKIQAATVLLDRGHGKPKQEIENHHIYTFQDFVKEVRQREEKLVVALADITDVTPIEEKKVLTWADVL